MSILSFIALSWYILSLAATQTVYGSVLLNYRWYALLTFMAASSADWVLHRIQNRPLPHNNASFILTLYLAGTGISVVFAENWQFSGMRWVAHGVMLLAFMLFLRQTVSPGQIHLILLLLKTSVVSLLVVSWIAPANPTIFEDFDLYRGAMGNSNSMGHIGLITALLFFHALMTGRRSWMSYLNGALAFSAIVTVWSTGARSSMVALIAGLALMIYLYRRKIGGMIPLSFILASLLALAWPTLPREIIRFVVKKQGNEKSIGEQALKTRTPLWLAALEGFKKRPICGWGFGADSNISQNWVPRLTALGTVKRDATNDLLFMMEGCGVLGVVAYLLLIRLAIGQAPGRRQLEMYGCHDDASYLVAGRGPPLHHVQAILFVLSMSLLVLTQFDGSGLSAGNFISAVLWLSMGSAGALLERGYSVELARGSIHSPPVPPICDADAKAIV